MSIEFIRHSETPGQAVWKIIWRPDGKKGGKRTKNFEGTREQAETFEQAILHAAGLDRKSRSTVKVTSLTLEAALPEYLRWHGLNRAKKTHIDVKMSMPRLMQIFGKMTTGQIKPSHITDFVAMRPDKKRANQKDIHYLQGLISWMVENNYADPLSFKPQTPKYHRPIPMAPISTDVDAILAYITDPLTRALIYLMWNTGARIGTANQIRWENINWERGTITVTVKGGDNQALPIPEEFRELMFPLKKETGWVFENKKTGKPVLSIKKTLATASRKAGLSYTMTHHKFRHAYATDTLEACGDLRLLQESLHHKDIKTTTIYTKIKMSRIVDAAALVSSLRKSRK
ncbi:MAG: tyrosine-type recombinase/integrase [Desulfocapsaceae bacterium]|nr:tyrosine-type recombinase/integrase [Desulfocapsaceae bacterium]